MADGEAILPVSFTTARLRAERLMAAHAAEVRRMHVDPVVMAHLGGVQTEAQTAMYLAANLQHWADHGFGLWVVYERDGTEPIGRALLRLLPLDGRDEVETGYAFYQPYWGRGLASEVTRACLALGFGALNRTSIVAVTQPANHASRHVLAKAGFDHERDYDRAGTRCSLFRISRERWAATRS